MISLSSLAAEYRAQTSDEDGFELSSFALRSSVERAIRRELGTLVRLIASLGPVETCPPLYIGELRAAIHAAKVAERDLEQVAAMRNSEAA